MNLRYKILEAVSKNPGAPASEICEAISYDKQKTTWSVRDCAKAGLLSVRRDDVSGLPGYTLTDAGKARLAEGPASKQGSNMQQEAARKDGASSEPDRQDHQPPEQATEITDLKQRIAELEFSARLVHTLLAEHTCGDINPDLSEIELAERAALLLSDASYETSKWQQRASAQDQALQQQTALVAEQRRAIQASTELLTDKDAELQRQAGLIVELRAEVARLQSENIALKTLNDAMPGFGAAFNAGTQHVGYLLRAAKRKPMTIKSEEKARAAALSAIKAGAQRAEVFALVPVGCARKAATWEPA